MILRLVLLLLMLLPGLAAARDSVILGSQLEPPGLDPTGSASAAIGEVTFPTLYEGLVHLGLGGAVEPGLATSWEVAPDGLTYIFHLRQGVRFQDGSAFDAEAVRFSLTRVADAGSRNPQKPLFACIEAVDASDPATVTLHLSRPYSSLLQALGLSAAIMVSPASAANNATNPIGTGPFRFESWRRGDAVTLRRNPDYWGEAPKLDRVTYRFIADPNAALDALSAGDIDAFAAFPAPESIARLRRDPRFDVTVAPSEAKTILAINNRRKPFDDIRVRQALGAAIDRRAIIDAAMFGFGTPIGSHYAPIEPGYVDLTGWSPYDPARAKQLLAEAGYPNGFHATLRLPPLSYARRSGEIVAAELARIGVTADITSMEWAPWLDQVFGQHDFDLTIVAHVEPMDYGIYARDNYYFGYAAPDFKALLGRLDAAQDPAERLTLLGDVQRKIAEDAVNVFLFDFPALGVRDKRLEDIWYRTPVQGVDLIHAHWTGSAAEIAGTQAGQGSERWLAIALGAAGALGAGFLLLRAGPLRALGRIASLGLTLLLASAVIFAVIQLAPGDPARFMLGMNADPAALAALRSDLGLDQPLPLRYLAWLGHVLTGDFGTSWTYHQPVGRLILERLAVSLPLTLYALVISTVLALALGIAAVQWCRNWAGKALAALAQLGIAVPNFWVGIMLVAVFSVGLRWFSGGGFAGWQAGPLAALKSLTLPAVALALPQAAILARVLRAALLEALGQDYLRTARAKGLSEGQALRRHALPNSLLPVLTVLGLQFSFLLAGGVLIENVFFLPGLGRLVFEAIAQRDLIVVESVSIVLVAQVVLVTLLADLASTAADPRLRRAP